MNSWYWCADLFVINTLFRALKGNFIFSALERFCTFMTHWFHIISLHEKWIGFITQIAVLSFWNENVTMSSLHSTRYNQYMPRGNIAWLLNQASSEEFDISFTQQLLDSAILIVLYKLMDRIKLYTLQLRKCYRLLHLK